MPKTRANPVLWLGAILVSGTLLLVGFLSVLSYGVEAADTSRPAAFAAILVVNTDVDESDGSCVDGDCSLRDAISTANAGDLITFDNDYTIYLSSTLGVLVIDKELTIDGSIDEVTISGDTSNDGDRDVQVLQIGALGVVTMSHMSVVSGTATDGGGIINHGTLNIISSTIQGNHASGRGGGIWNRGRIIMQHSDIVSNTAVSHGGGIGLEFASHLTISNSNLISNSGGTLGGGIGGRGRATLYQTMVQNNEAAQGGGLGGNRAESYELTRSDVRQNRAVNGGGMALYNSGSLAVIDTTVTGNEADGGAGGGIDSDFFITLSLTDSVVSQNRATSEGGGIDADGVFNATNLQVLSNTVTGGNGGGIQIGHFRPAQLVSLTVAYNQAEAGGGLHGSGVITMTSAAIFSNTAASGGGGGLYLDGRATLVSADIYSNVAVSGEGGGIYNGLGLDMINSSVRGNYATSDGGGIYNNAFAALPVRLSNVTVSNNQSGGQGGGIGETGGSAIELSNVTVSSNRAVSGGGGIQLSLGISADFSHVTLAANNSISGAQAIQLPTLAFVDLENSIIDSDLSPACVLSSTFNSTGYNLASDGSCGLTGTGDITNTNPLLGQLQNNGGGTLTHALLDGSPAIDHIPAGTNDCGTSIVDDQRGAIRPQDGDEDGTRSCDIGAYEVQQAISKFGPSKAVAFDPFTYTLAIVNDSPISLTNVVITDAIPAGATYVSGGTQVGGVVSWTLDSIAPWETITRQFAVSAETTIVNFEYGLSANSGFSATGCVSVTTQIEHRTYLPLIAD